MVRQWRNPARLGRKRGWRQRRQQAQGQQRGGKGQRCVAGSGKPPHCCCTALRARRAACKRAEEFQELRRPAATQYCTHWQCFSLITAATAERAASMVVWDGAMASTRRARERGERAATQRLPRTAGEDTSMGRAAERLMVWGNARLSNAPHDLSPRGPGSVLLAAATLQVPAGLSTATRLTRRVYRVG